MVFFPARTSCRVGIAAVTLAACVSVAQAAPVATISGGIPAAVANGRASLIGPAPADQVMHLAIAMPQRNVAALDDLLRDIYNPRSPNFRHYLTVAAFTERFGPTQSDYDAAVQFFASQGLAIEARTANRNIIDIAGKVADLNRVFHISLGMYRHPVESRTFISPDRAPTLDLAVPVQQVIGLDDYVKPYTKLVFPAKKNPPPGVGGSGPQGYFIGSDMRAAYYPTGSLNGAGQSVGLMELEGYNIADVNSFFAKKYGADNNVDVVGVKTDSASLNCTGSCDDTEQALDIEYTISVAPSLASVRVYVGNIPEDVLNAMASDNLSKVLSTSWGWNENFAVDDGVFKEFAAQGQTNLTASGDYSSLQDSGPWPEEDANIVAVGGTDVTTKTPGGPWSGETGWSGSAGGPSLDKSIKIEPYQKPFINKKNAGSKKLRDVPDVAANADTDMYLCADGTCVGGYGGTSFASPMWAGIVAMANQQAAAAGGNPVGFINPAIYALATNKTAYATQFHDITVGTSGVYHCTRSYDLVTGLGSPQGQTFIDALVGN
jgi:subtilase family serine protease